MAISQQFVNSVRELVSDHELAIDFESGLCRFCNAVVEAYDETAIEGHRPDCPWERVRALLPKAS